MISSTDIETAIANAKEEEFSSGELFDFLHEKLNALPAVIELPENEPIVALRDFILEYISHLPSFVTAVKIAANEAGISEYVDPFLQMALDTFATAIAEDLSNVRMLDLLEHAYLGHRLVEEVNDQYIVHSGIPLMPMDITKANVIVHQLLDEAIAVNIDCSVDDTAKMMQGRQSVFASEHFARYVETRKGKGWDQVWNQWAELTNALDIDLALSPKQVK